MVDSNFMCFTCKHLRPIDGGCDAFPKGIPMSITDEGRPHTEPLPGQKNKIVYEPLAEGESWATPATWPKTTV